MDGIRELRTMANLTQFEVAKKSGLDRTRLSLAECGHVTLSHEEEVAVRKALLDHIESRAAQLRDVLSGKQAAAV
jgi:transcriptional regulator with XRE-family HTH domain